MFIMVTQKDSKGHGLYTCMCTFETAFTIMDIPSEYKIGAVVVKIAE